MIAYVKRKRMPRISEMGIAPRHWNMSRLRSQQDATTADSTSVTTLHRTQPQQPLRWSPLITTIIIISHCARTQVAFPCLTTHRLHDLQPRARIISRRHAMRLFAKLFAYCFPSRTTTHITNVATFSCAYAYLEHRTKTLAHSFCSVRQYNSRLEYYSHTWFHNSMAAAGPRTLDEWGRTAQLYLWLTHSKFQCRAVSKINYTNRVPRTNHPTAAPAK